MPANNQSEKDVAPLSGAPKMPPAAYVGTSPSGYVAYYTADQMRAMYLAGIEAARGAVESCAKDDDGWVYPPHVFANLDALGEGVT